ncbi:MAG TPA: GspH/FimT family pseudopilin [Longimicrobiaceae bacterium]|nr:GspH/FimT family pseudopilin [Longimicrobiaceae bacterium]
MTATTPHRRPSVAGFTLVELMAVLILIGIGVSMAAPRVTSMASRNKAEGAISRLGADMAYARILAVRWGRPTSLRFSASGTEYTVTVDTAGTASPNFRVVKRVSIDRDFAGISLSPPAAQVSFTPRGMVTAGEGTFTAGHGAVADSLLLFPTGRTYRAK